MHWRLGGRDTKGRALRALLFAVVSISLVMFRSAALAEPARLGPRNVAVVVNVGDPRSLEVGEFYRQARAIPSRNVIKVALPDRARTLSPAAFDDLRRRIDGELPTQIEVVVFVWTTPYAVGCNSITSAYTMGFDAEQCANTCGPGKPSRYFDSTARRPHAELGTRLSMLLPSDDVPLAKAVINRGKLSAFRVPQAGAYFVITADPHRNSRAQFFPPSQRVASHSLHIETVRTEAIEDKNDVMIYETGAVNVRHLASLQFLPGALADHLTSAGGDLLGHSQMSSLKWLEAGATASYGTVSEPCNHWQKFPNSAVLLKHYLAGDTAVEAYWKSVAWPTQGLFIGEPLAAPYALFRRGSRDKD
jgi:uncharacterized protein (TIGR03790 family)